jgi:hypothetical protein
MRRDGYGRRLLTILHETVSVNGSSWGWTPPVELPLRNYRITIMETTTGDEDQSPRWGLQEAVSLSAVLGEGGWRQQEMLTLRRPGGRGWPRAKFDINDLFWISYELISNE